MLVQKYILICSDAKRAKTDSPLLPSVDTSALWGLEKRHNEVMVLTSPSPAAAYLDFNSVHCSC